MTQNDTQQTLEFMKLALLETQTTVRGYDTKAQIVGVGYIFALNIIFTVADLLPKVNVNNDIDIYFVIGAWLVMISPIILFGCVLYPSRKTVKHLASQSDKISRVLYLEPEKYSSLDEYIGDCDTANTHHELAYELFKVSILRELKRKRFVRALFSSAMAFLILFLGQMARVSLT